MLRRLTAPAAALAVLLGMSAGASLPAHADRSALSDGGGATTEPGAHFGESAPGWEAPPARPASWQEPLALLGDPAGPADDRTRARLADTSSSSSSSSSSTITYDVVVFGLDTPTGPHGVTEASARTMIERLDSEYDAETQGRYRFRFHSFETLPAATSATCNVTQMNQTYRSHVEDAIGDSSPSHVTWAFVTAKQVDDCPYGSQAVMGAAGIHMNGHFTPGDPVVYDDYWGPMGYLDVDVLAHEVGHNLGLGHAAGVMPDGSNEPFAEPTAMIHPYGDSSDVMGSNHHTHRFNGLARDRLGLMPADAFEAAAGTSATYAISALDSDAPDRMLVVPVASKRMYVLEYRPAGGRDEPMRWQTDSDDPGGPGVYVRFNKVHRSDMAGRVGYDAAVLPTPDSPVGRTPHAGFTPGTQLELADGIRLEFGAQDATTAQVTVTRPADTTAPTISDLHLCRDAVDTCHLDGAPVALHSLIGPPGSSINDDVWVDSVVWTIDGVEVHRHQQSPAAPLSMVDRHAAVLDTTFVPVDGPVIDTGTHTVELRVSDLAGNTTSRTWTLHNTVAPPTIRPGAPGKPVVKRKTRTKAVVRWAPGQDATHYVVLQKRGGAPIVRIGKTNRTRMVVRNLKPGRYKFHVRSMAEIPGDTAISAWYRVQRG